jgi:ATP adenylyltransferase
MCYIKGINQQDTGCIFCEKPKEKKDRDNLILYRGKRCFVILNAYPYNNGHLMVVPYTHTGDFTGLKPGELTEMMTTMQQSITILKDKLNPDGFNWGANMGRGAGAGITDHVHIHVVPRWTGDTNYMPVIGSTKIISECLEETYDCLVPVFKERGK